MHSSIPCSTDRRRILIVEDDYDSNLFFKVILSDAGFFVSAYSDPLEALSEFKPNFYDILLIDVRMPSINGFKLYQKLRKKDDKAKVCFMTSFEMYYEAMVERYPSLKDICFIRKPVSPKDLIERMQKILLQ